MILVAGRCVVGLGTGPPFRSPFSPSEGLVTGMVLDAYGQFVEQIIMTQADNDVQAPTQEAESIIGSTDSQGSEEENEALNGIQYLRAGQMTLQEA